MQMNFKQGISSPPFKVRDSKAINEELNLSTLPRDFMAIEMPTYMNHDINDDVSVEGCQWIKEVNAERKYNDTIYSEYEYMR